MHSESRTVTRVASIAWLISWRAWAMMSILYLILLVVDRAWLTSLIGQTAFTLAALPIYLVAVWMALGKRYRDFHVVLVAHEPPALATDTPA